MTYRPIDSAAVATPDAAHVSVVRQITENLRTGQQWRHMGGSHAYYGGGGGTAGSVPIVSTHPDEWWGIPILIPTQRGATSVSMVVRLSTSAAADGEVRLRVGDATGTPATVTASTSDDLIEVTCGIPSYVAGQSWRAELQFRSGVAASGTSVDIEEYTADGRRVRVYEASLAIPTGACHYAFVLTSPGVGYGTEYRTRYYAGNCQDPYTGQGANSEWLRIYPALQHPITLASSSGAKETGTLYAVTAFSVLGWAWSLTGDDTSAYDLDDGAYRSLYPMRANAASRLQSELATIYRERRRVLCCAPAPQSTAIAGLSLGSTDGIVGAYVDAGGLAGATLLQHRQDLDSVRIEWLCAPMPGTIGTSLRFAWTATVAEWDGSPTTSVSATVETVREAAAGLDPGAGTIIGLHQSYPIGSWGGRDLIGDGESAILTYGHVVVPLVADVGDWEAVKLELDAAQTGRIWVGALTISERIGGV